MSKKPESSTDQKPVESPRYRPLVRDRFNTRRSPTIIEGKSLTKQSFKDQVDVNSIVAKFNKTGMVDHVNPRTPLYGDFTNAQDYMTALNAVREAEANFEALPSAIRDICDNNPGVFLDFVQDPANAETMRELGLDDLADAYGYPKADPTPPVPPSKPEAHRADPEPRDAPSSGDDQK